MDGGGSDHAALAELAESDDGGEEFRKMMERIVIRCEICRGCSRRWITTALTPLGEECVPGLHQLGDMDL